MASSTWGLLLFALRFLKLIRIVAFDFEYLLVEYSIGRSPQQQASGCAETFAWSPNTCSRRVLNLIQLQVTRDADAQVVVAVADCYRLVRVADSERADVFGDEAEVVATRDGAEDLPADDDAGDFGEDGRDIFHADSGQLGVQ